MFTLDQIHQAASKIKSGADFPQYVQDLKSIGVSHYDNYVSDGRTNYFGSNGYTLNGEPKYPLLAINASGSEEKLKLALSIHQAGQTDYMTFCRQAAEAGIEKWTTDMISLKVTYFDIIGNEVVVEAIPQP
ncbi:MAG: DUF1398 family protein [Crocinitomicaceae bacterium]|nr:DUF1398 family protein [Crocinitomicaceae bacterium]